MSRELKFKQLVNGEWYDFGWIEEDVFTGPPKIDKEKYPIVQYTGLKDKNGVEIYESSEVDGMLVEWSDESLSYVLINISIGDIVSLADYVRDKNGQVKVTKEYAKL